MTDKPDAEEAARRIVKAFTTGGADKGDDPVIVARAYLDQAAEIERLRAALAEARQDVISVELQAASVSGEHT